MGQQLRWEAVHFAIFSRFSSIVLLSWTPLALDQSQER
jgi:hypothetical protein